MTLRALLRGRKDRHAPDLVYSPARRRYDATMEYPVGHRSRLAIVLGPDGDLTQVPLRAGRMTIGRATDNDVSVNDHLLSRHHAVLHVGASIHLEDLGSRNGTVVHAPRETGDASPQGDDTGSECTRRLKNETIELHEGAVVSLGGTRLVVRAATPQVNLAIERAVVYGGSPRMRTAWDLATQAAASRLPVLLMGETGVGKGVLAERIHRLSPWADHAFLRVSCATGEAFLERALFGREDSGRPGAGPATPGVFEGAQGGTLLLNDIDELPLSLQSRLLCVLDEGAVLRSGGRHARPIDVRIIAAGSRRLGDKVAAGEFRKDLYLAFSGLELIIPPLRERIEEIRTLAQTFAEMFAATEKRPVPAFDEEAMLLLEQYAWPGNIRELRQAVRHALVVNGSGCIGVDDLPKSIRTSDQRPSDRPLTWPTGTLVLGGRSARLDISRMQILDALEQHAWNQTRVARALKISRGGLVKLIERYGIPRPRK